MTPDDAVGVLDAVLDELAEVQAQVRTATWTVAELEELAEEGEAGREELAEALDALAAAETKLDALRRKRIEAEAALDRLEVERVHARRSAVTSDEETR